MDRLTIEARSLKSAQQIEAALRGFERELLRVFRGVGEVLLGRKEGSLLRIHAIGEALGEAPVGAVRVPPQVKVDSADVGTTSSALSSTQEPWPWRMPPSVSPSSGKKESM